jgi:hypothetical protein
MGPRKLEALAFSPDARLLATADADTAVRVYDAHTGRLISENHDFLMEPLALAFTGNGEQVIAAGGDRVTSFIDANTGKTNRSLPKTDHSVFFSGLSVSPDGTQVALLFMKAEKHDPARPGDYTGHFVRAKEVRVAAPVPGVRHGLDARWPSTGVRDAGGGYLDHLARPLDEIPSLAHTGSSFLILKSSEICIVRFAVDLQRCSPLRDTVCLCVGYFSELSAVSAVKSLVNRGVEWKSQERLRQQRENWES